MDTAATATIPYLAPLLQLVEAVEQLMLLCRVTPTAIMVALAAVVHINLRRGREFHIPTAQAAAETHQAFRRLKATMAVPEKALLLILALVAVVVRRLLEVPVHQRLLVAAATERHQLFLDRPPLMQAVAAVAHQ
jgi:hypothetical protein